MISLLLMEEHPANQLRLVVYPIMYQVVFIPGGAGFLPSTVYGSVKSSTCSFLRVEFRLFTFAFV